jgi:ABC-type uncharacterized transport system involved in gliding motility auxiliary subunit
VTIRYYVTAEDRVMPPMLKTHSRTVQDLILEFQKAAKGKVILEKMAPNPNTEDEDKAREDDIQGVPVNTDGDNVYLGLAIQCAKQKEVLPFLNPNEETALEYNVARAIQKVSKEKKTVVGVMSSMPIIGSPMFPFQRQQGQQPWVLIQRLRMDYEVREVQMTAASIDNDVSVLVVVHPADITEQAEYAIDQYLMKGGQVVALVDPQCLVAQRVYSGQQNPMTGQPGGVVNPTSDLPNLFKAWGVTYNKADIVADVNYRTQLMGRQTPVALRLPSEALNRQERITADLQSLLFMMTGTLDVVSKDGITATVLAASSEASELIDNTTAEKLLREPVSNFNASGKKQTLAVMLKGKFKTAFPGGKPKAPAEAKPEGGGAQDDASAPKTSATPAATPAAEAKKDEAKPAEPAKPADGTILESQNAEGVVVVFADADMMYDAFTVQQDPMTGGMVAVDGNLPMFLNTVEILSGGGDLLQVRSRASTRRPFAKMDELRENVEKKFRPSLTQKQAEMDKIAADMGPLRVKNGQLVDPAQIKKLQELMEKQTQIKREIREIKKDQNKDIDFTQNIITLLNVFGVPLLVVAVGLTLAIRRRATTAAA